MYIKHSIFVFLSAVSLISVFYSAGKLFVFLSIDNKSRSTDDDSVIWNLLMDMLLLAAFMLQHTLMVLLPYQKYLYNIGLNVVSRSIYNFSTSLTLLVLIKYWRTTGKPYIWDVDTTNVGTWIVFIIIHLFAWSVVYTGCLFMDMSELLGVKQVYYSIRKMPNPMSFKSAELQRLYCHTRHPSFMAFTLIFWIYPIMSLDRLLFASILTGYMYITWKTDKYDICYQRNQYQKKTEELSRMY